MTICSRTIDYCFPIVLGCFRNFCNIIIPKQGIEMHFSLNGLWTFLKLGTLPVKLHSKSIDIRSQKDAEDQKHTPKRLGTLIDKSFI